jgi:hypothetical protein
MPPLLERALTAAFNALLPLLMLPAAAADASCCRC